MIKNGICKIRFDDKMIDVNVRKKDTIKGELISCSFGKLQTLLLAAYNIIGRDGVRGLIPPCYSYTRVWSEHREVQSCPPLCDGQFLTLWACKSTNSSY